MKIQIFTQIKGYKYIIIFSFFLQLKAIMTDEVNNLQPVEITTWDQYLLSQEVITQVKRIPQRNILEFPSIPRQRCLISIPEKSPNLIKTQRTLHNRPQTPKTQHLNPEIPEPQTQNPYRNYEKLPDENFGALPEFCED